MSKCDDAKLIKRPKTTEQFIKDARKVHGNKYNYDKTVYVHNTKPVIITCPVHGDFEQTPNAHTSNTYNCPKCSQRYEYTLQDLQAKAHNTLVCNKILKNSRVEVTCSKHGKQIMTKASILKGLQCLICGNRTGFNPTKPGILYYLSINNGQAYKIGITNKSVQERFSVTELKSIQVLKTWYYKDGYNTYRKEQLLLKRYANYKYCGTPLLVNGNTELFNRDVLKLDKG